MKVLVCGGRDFNNYDVVSKALYRIHEGTPITLLIEGGAHGADHCAYLWARTAQVQCEKFPADWRSHGKAAGPIRNQRMIDEAKPDLVVAFPGGRGTADMVRRAETAGVEVLAVPHAAGN